MNKKTLGFTLVELLAVIVILSAIMLIIIPLVTNNVRESSETAVIQSKESIELSARNWASDHANLLPADGGSICVSVRALIQEGYLDSNGADDFLNGSVVISNTDNVYYYTYQEVGCVGEESVYNTITLNYTENGGTRPSGQPESIEVMPGDTVNLSNYEGTKSGYEFVGWNTNKDAHSGFEEYTMPSSGDIELYAIFKKTVNIDFVVQNTLAATASKDSASCTMYNNTENCSITTPTLTTVAGAEAFGWSTDEDATTATVSAGANITVTKDDTYYAVLNILDNEAPTCSLKITNGTLGNNSWYTSDVTVTMTTDDTGGSGVTDYGLTTSSTETYNQNASVIHTSDGTSITYYGYVRDGVGNTGKCSITFKKDAVAPTCTSSGGGTSTSSVTIKGTCSDATSGCKSTTVTKKVTTSGSYSPGTVEDKAGHTTTCPKQTVKIGQTLTTGGKEGQWYAIYNERSSCDSWAARCNGSCNGVYANVIGKVDVSYTNNKVKISWKIALGSETWVRNGYYVYLRVYKSGTQVKSKTLKSSSAYWNNSCYSGSVTYTLSNGSYTVKFEGNSSKPSFDHTMAKFTLT